MAKLCSNCGAQVKDTAKFCALCGEALSQEQSEIQPVQPPVQQPQAVPQQQIPQSFDQPSVQPQQPYVQQKPDIQPGVPRQPIQPQYQQPNMPAPVQHKSKTPFIVAGAAGLGVIALIVVLIVTNVFGLLGKTESGNVNVSVSPDAKNGNISEPLSDVNDVPSYIAAYITGLTDMYNQGEELSQAGLFLQANWFYSFSGASAGAMRCYLDALIAVKGGAVPPQDELRLYDWEQIGLINQASPYPWMYESFALRAEGKTAEADAAWANAMQNPLVITEFADVASLFDEADVGQLIEARGLIAAFEDTLFEVYLPVEKAYKRDPNGWDANYYYELGKDALRGDEPDYDAALVCFEAALTVDPINSNVYHAMAIVYLYIDDPGLMFYYINEGLRVEPEHKGLKNLLEAIEKAGESIE